MFGLSSEEVFQACRHGGVSQTFNGNTFFIAIYMSDEQQ